MKEVSGSATPLATGGGGGATTARPFDVRRAVIAVVALFLVIWAVKILFFHPNRYEALADRVTKAIINNDMTPVKDDFNAVQWPFLADRGKVGNLSDFLGYKKNGNFKGAKENTPSGSDDGYHTFVAHFDKDNVAEDMTLDQQGKIVHFHVKPLN